MRAITITIVCPGSVWRVHGAKTARNNCKTHRWTIPRGLKARKPVLDILRNCDKIKMQHYCPLHPQVVTATLPVLESRRDDERIFEQLAFQQWLRHNKVQLRHGGARIVNGDLRKFSEHLGM